MKLITEIMSAIGRSAYRGTYLLIYIYWFVFRPRREGVQLIIKQGYQVFLIRHTYMHSGKWALPGGGTKRGESAEASARRELREELGVGGAIQLLGVYDIFHDYHHDTIHVFVASIWGQQPSLSAVEIDEGRWFDARDLPERLTPLLEALIEQIGREVIAGVEVNGS